MLKDRIFKLLSALTLFSILFYHLSKSFNFNNLSFITGLFYFLTLAFFVVNLSVEIISRLRRTELSKNVFIRIGILTLATVSFSTAVIFISLFVWQLLWLDKLVISSIYETIVTSTGLTIFFSLFYEILFLSKERELDTKVVKHLDTELQHAELNILKNELDPHFVYNSLMPLYYLIKNDVQQAEVFSYKLMQVYQHFLQNRNKDYITLEEELKFIDNYFYLLKIRYKDSLDLKMVIEQDPTSLLIIPFTLQLLIENAIKHNRFDKENKLEIVVRLQQHILIVSNNYRTPYEETRSSKIGLHNIRIRYRVLFKRKIYILKNSESFIVKIPLLTNIAEHDVSRYFRG
jgi:LytS/YehU family sensor histidine kinase